MPLALSHQHLEHLCQQEYGNCLDDVIFALVDVLVKSLDQRLGVDHLFQRSPEALESSVIELLSLESSKLTQDA